MGRVVVLPPAGDVLADGAKLGGWWHESEDGARIVCDVCPRGCRLKPGDRGFCFVRENRDGQMVLSTYGRSTGFCIDPIEKKPLNHFYPGTSILSFGTAGCNLGCKFCQNWDISKSREVARLSEFATPDMIAAAARELDCRSVAYTYNEPVIFAEYAIDVARAARAVGVKSVAVTAGYITPAARETLFREMDAANVDLKAFTEDFYHRLTYSHLQPVLDTLRWLKHETDVWFEITNLIIPDENDAHDELRRMCDWVLENVGDSVPLHFSAFHPDFRLRDTAPTPPATLQAAYEIAQRQGVKYVYVGNVDDAQRQSTYCPHCRRLLIERNWYDLGSYALRGDRCQHCGGTIAGRFADGPGTWGRKRLPVRISQFAPPPPAPAPRAVLERNPSMAKEDTSPPASPSNVMQSPDLTPAQEAAIHRAACEVVKAGVLGQPVRLSDPTLAGCAQQLVMGAFVTLKRHGHLRACCGMLGRPVGVVDAVSHAATRTATEDTRFPTISPTELEHLDLDVTLLFAFQPIAARGRQRIQEVVVGRHGLQIQRGGAAGLLLPSVATEYGWDAEEFLQHVCRKAGLPTNAWQADDARLLKFEGRMVPGLFEQAVLTEGERGGKPPLFSSDELRRLAEQCRVNVLQLMRGATPNYYLPGCPDGTVEGVTISLQPAGAPEPLQFSQLSLRPGVPLQSTLYTLAEAAAGALQRQRIRPEALNQVPLGLTVLYDPAMHGPAADADVAGVDPARRAVLVMEHGHSAWVFDPQKTPAELLAAARRDAQLTSSSSAAVISLAVQSTEAQAALSSVPRPRPGVRVRPPAVAGAFYPDDAAELAKMVDTLLGGGEVRPEPWPAALVPHAGWVYSGRGAAAPPKRVAIPETVILIGPRHTRQGVDSAVAPHEIWSLPGLEVKSDPVLAHTLADKVPGLQLDAAAHQQEHCLEVQLPLLARLAPQSRVVGITIGGADLARCRQLGAGLAEAIRDMQPRPLLLISTDMNHFASDADTRRLDEIALQAIETLDPAQVYETVVVRHGISMCGVRPAVIVLEALRQLQQLSRCERVAYATSAEVSGDKNRVVGYAGMLFG
jgi:AmmeMemoRadiSam system radical SAM enzyme/AmmeMemoRadiSam system protein B/AmmeMemoRadiSam system protein A